MGQRKWGRWRRVYAMARGTNLRVGATEEEINAEAGPGSDGIFKLTKAVVRQTHGFLSKHANQFELSSPYVKKLEFYARSATEMAEWIAAIQSCIDEANADALEKARQARHADGRRADDHLLWASDDDDEDDR